MPKVIIEIDDEGNTIIMVNGVKGEACMDLTRELQKRFGKVKNVQKTQEYEEEVTQEIQRRVTLGR